MPHDQDEYPVTPAGTIGLNEWPRAVAEYVIDATGDAPRIVVTVALSAAGDASAPDGGGIAGAGSANAERYGGVLAALELPGTRVTVSTSLCQAPGEAPMEIEVDALPLRSFVRAARAFLADEAAGTPPVPVVITASLGAGYVAKPAFPEKIFRLTTALTIVHAIPAAGSSAAATVADVTYLAPRAVAMSADARTALAAFARDAEAAFAGTIKVAVRSADDVAANHVWIVDAGATGIASVAIDGSDPAFFARPPVSTSLHDAVAIDVAQFDPVAGDWLPDRRSVSVSAVDLDTWTLAVLTAVDTVLAPRCAVPARRHNERAFATLLDAKATLADTIAAGVVPLIDGGHAGVVADARERLREALFAGLANGFAAATIVQYPANVNSPYADRRTAPRLSWQPHVCTGDATGIVSTATTSLANGPSTVNVLATPPAEPDGFPRDVVRLDLRYRIDEVQRGGAAPSDDGDNAAWSRLAFVLPIGGNIGAQPIDTNLGAVAIPLPLHACPPAPVLYDRTASATVDHPADPTAAKQWTYAFTFDRPAALHDTLHIRLAYNVTAVPAGAADGTADDRLMALAQFVTAYPAMSPVLDGLANAPDTTEPVLAATLDAFAALVERIARTWRYDPPPVDAMSHARAPSHADDPGTYEYAVSFTTSRGDDGAPPSSALVLELIAPGEPSLTSAFPDIFRRTSGGEWTPLAKSPSATRTCVYYGYDGGTFVPPEHRFAVGGLDVVRAQNVACAARVTRNARIAGSVPASQSFTSTAAVAYPADAPLLAQRDIIAIRTGDASVEQSVTAFFATLFGRAPVDLWIEAAVRFGYELTPAIDDGTPPFVAHLPVTRIPLTAYVAAVPVELAASIDVSESSMPVDPGSGWFAFDVTVSSSTFSRTPVPLLRIANAYFDRAAAQERTARTTV